MTLKFFSIVIIATNSLQFAMLLCRTFEASPPELLS